MQYWGMTLRKFDRSCEHAHGFPQPGTFENWKYALKKQLTINAALEIECREPQDPVCASLVHIASALDLRSQQNKFHMLMFSQEVKRQVAGLATSLHLLKCMKGDVFIYLVKVAESQFLVTVFHSPFSLKPFAPRSPKMPAIFFFYLS